LTLSWRYTAISDTGRVRQNNQDSGYAGEHLLCVADGMGGAAAGDLASTVVVQTLRRLDAPAPNDLLEALAGAVLRANVRLAEIVESDPTVEGMGTTATAIVLDGDRAGLVHIGDSRAYRLRAGRLEQLTEDHTLVQSLVDEGRITAEEARHHPHRSLILRVLDGRQEIQPDLHLVDLQPGDRLLVCSDGLCGFVADGDIARVLGSGTVDSAAVDLLRLALDSGSSDNVTCVVGELVGAAPPAGTTTPDGSDRDDLADTTDGELAAISTGPMLVGAVSEESRSRAMSTAAPPRAGRYTTATAATAPTGEGSSDDPEQLRYAPLAPGGFRRLRGLLIAVALLVLLVVAGLLAYRWSQQQYFVAESDGRVAIYQGVRVDLPGLDLSDEYQSTGVLVANLPDYNAGQVADGMPADDLADAQAIVTRLDALADECAGNAATASECEGAGSEEPYALPTPQASAEATSREPRPTRRGQR
jgi:protein phosphatase